MNIKNAKQLSKALLFEIIIFRGFFFRQLDTLLTQCCLSSQEHFVWRIGVLDEK